MTVNPSQRATEVARALFERSVEWSYCKNGWTFKQWVENDPEQAEREWENRRAYYEDQASAAQAAIAALGGHRLAYNTEQPTTVEVPLEDVIVHESDVDPNAEVRDSETGELIFPARKAPFHVVPALDAHRAGGVGVDLEELERVVKLATKDVSGPAQPLPWSRKSDGFGDVWLEDAAGKFVGYKGDLVEEDWNALLAAINAVPSLIASLRAARASTPDGGEEHE